MDVDREPADQRIADVGLSQLRIELAKLREQTRLRLETHDFPWNSSRPISMRRISFVPAPIS